MSHGHHDHNYGTYRTVDGFIWSPSALHHPELGESDNVEPHHCAICMEYMWITERALNFSSMRPEIPKICCICAETGVEALRRALPDHEVVLQPRAIPDFGRDGTFN